MKGKVIGYWVATGLSVLGLGVGGFFDLINAPFAQEIMKHLGYPPYLATLLGVWKMVGLAVILAPGLARAKEWAYAGFTIDLVSASYSHGMSGDGPKDFLPPFLFLAVLAASWALRPPSRVMGQIRAGSSSAAPASGAAAAT